MEYLSSKHVGVCIGDYVKVDGESGYSEGTVCDVLLQKYPPRVRLENGDAGYVVNIINSRDVVLRRIMNEGQYTENKENFCEQIMRDEVIPKTVQSFLNSEGGYLYIGVRDTGEQSERLVGLNRDFDMIDSPDRSNDKLCDILQGMIIGSLEKHLRSNTSLGSLVEIKIINVLDTQIVEIRIQKSPMPWFYTHISKKNKRKKFKCFDGQSMHERELDDFYIRQGNAKKRLDTHEDFYMYAENHFHSGWSVE